MKVLIDTNIILDVLCQRKEFCECSSEIFKLCEIEKISGIVSALSISNIMYILRKELNTDKIRQVLEGLSLIFSIADLTANDLKMAAKMEFKDYEDAIQSATANRIKANYIITRNIKDFSKSKILAVTPDSFLDGFKI